ncbi:MAG: hypothetical protein ACRDHY_19065, partial [Anaerolineales bacterium]
MHTHTRALPTLRSILFALGLLGSLVPDLAGAQTVQLYYAAPTAAMVSTFGAGSVFGGVADGYRAVPVTPANSAAFQSIAPPNVLRTYNALQPGTTLRNRMDGVLRVSGGVVDVSIVLFDDRTGISGHSSFATSTNAAGQQYIWPAAGVGPKQANNRYQAAIGVGEQASAHIQTWPGGWLAWEGALLHESLHTQFVGEKTKWGGPTGNGVDIVYGGDGSHWIFELLGEQELPFEEGLGTFYGTMHNNPEGARNLV